MHVVPKLPALELLPPMRMHHQVPFRAMTLYGRHRPTFSVESCFRRPVWIYPSTLSLRLHITLITVHLNFSCVSHEASHHRSIAHRGTIEAGRARPDLSRVTTASPGGKGPSVCKRRRECESLLRRHGDYHFVMPSTQHLCFRAERHSENGRASG